MVPHPVSRQKMIIRLLWMLLLKMLFTNTRWNQLKELLPGWCLLLTMPFVAGEPIWIPTTKVHAQQASRASVSLCLLGLTLWIMIQIIKLACMEKPLMSLWSTHDSIHKTGIFPAMVFIIRLVQRSLVCRETACGEICLFAMRFSSTEIEETNVCVCVFRFEMIYTNEQPG